MTTPPTDPTTVPGGDPTESPFGDPSAPGPSAPDPSAPAPAAPQPMPGGDPVPDGNPFDPATDPGLDPQTRRAPEPPLS